MNRIVVCRRALESAVRRLVEQPSSFALWEAGQNRCPDLTELLCGRFQIVTFGGQSPLLANSSSWVVMALYRAADEREQIGRRVLTWWRQRLSAAPDGLAGFFALEQEPQRGSLAGAFLAKPGIAESLHVLKIVGPGMHQVWTSEGQAAFPEPALTLAELERWSRVIGALGEAAWRRLRCLRYVLIGVGRTGSLVATSLARLGARYVTLIDPDRVEPHNVDAMDGVSEDDIGREKVQALFQSFTAIIGSLSSAFPLAESITTLRAFVAAKEADILISCVDHDGARLASSILATLYAKPHLDIGTGIFGSQETRQMGADIRLILPGNRCLLCLGGVANNEQARSLLESQERSAMLLQRPWHEERAGSLRSLNQIAAHLGMRLLEDLVGERINHSVWYHLEFDHQGVPSLHTLTLPQDPSCLLCRHMGEGDTGLHVVKDLSRMLQV